MLRSKQMRKAEQFSNYKAFLMPGLILLVIILASLFLVKPQVKRIFDFRKKIQAEKQALTRLTEKVAILEGLDKAELNSKIETVVRVLPLEKDISYLLSVLRSLTDEAGVSINVVNINPGEISTSSAGAAKQSLSSLSFPLNLEGEMGKIRTLLDKVEETAPLMSIDRVSFSKLTTGVKATINLNIYDLSAPAGLGDINASVPILSGEEEKTYQRIVGFVVLKIEELPSVPSGKAEPFSL